MTRPDEPLLPDRTGDELDRGWGDDAVRDDVTEDDRRLLDDVPPHHVERD